MDAGELVKFVRYILDEFDPDAPEVFPGQAWALRGSGSLSLIGVLPEPPHIRLTTGVAVGVPISGNLALHVSTINQELWNGRAYLTGGPDIGAVVLQDIYFGDCLEFGFAPSIGRVGADLKTQLRKADLLGPELCARFGGRPLEATDIGVLVD